MLCYAIDRFVQTEPFALHLLHNHHRAHHQRSRDADTRLFVVAIRGPSPSLEGFSLVQWPILPRCVPAFISCFLVSSSY